MKHTHIPLTQCLLNRDVNRHEWKSHFNLQLIVSFWTHTKQCPSVDKLMYCDILSYHVYIYYIVKDKTKPLNKTASCHVSEVICFQLNHFLRPKEEKTRHTFFFSVISCPVWFILTLKLETVKINHLSVFIVVKLAPIQSPPNKH